MEPHVSCGSCIADGFFATEPLRKPRSKICTSQNIQKGTLGPEHQPCTWILLGGQLSGKITASSLISPKPQLLLKMMLRRKHVQECPPTPTPLRLSAVLLAREERRGGRGRLPLRRHQEPRRERDGVRLTPPTAVPPEPAAHFRGPGRTGRRRPVPLASSIAILCRAQRILKSTSWSIFFFF